MYNYGLNSVYENINDGVCINEIIYNDAGHPIDYKIIDTNPAYESITGFKREDVMGQRASVVFGTESPSHLYTYAKVAENGEKADFETYIPQKRSYFNISVTSPEKGKFIMILSDITDKNRLEKAIHEKNEFLTDIIENMWDLVSLTDKDCNFVYISPSHKFHLGYKPEDLIGKNIFDFIHHDDFHQVQNQYFSLLHTLKSIKVECRFRHADGHYKWLEVNANIVYDSNGILKNIIFNSRDITDRKKTEEKLKRKEEILELALNSASLVVWDCDLKKGELYFSEQFSKILGCSGKELTLDVQKWWNLIHPDDVSRVSKALNDYYNGKITFYESEHRLKDKSGKWVWLLDKGKITKKDDFGRPERLTGVILDITDKIEREEKIREYAKEIQETKITREKELHHRIKNNLQVISSLLSLQSEKFKDDIVKEAFIDAQNRVTSMAIVHNKLCQTEALENMNIKGYIEDLVNHLVGLYRRTNIDIEIDVEYIHFGIDTIIPLGMLINELVSNSLKYAFSETESGEVNIKLYQIHNRNYVLIVADNGCGLPYDIDVQGTYTLGLQLINSLIDQINGDFELDTSSGTKFIIEFSG